MAKLKMVAGKTYACPPVFGVERVLLRGEVVEVSQEHADILLADSYYDGLNNEHPYFTEVEDAPVAKKPAAKVAKADADDEDLEADDDSAAAPVPRTRTKK